MKSDTHIVMSREKLVVTPSVADGDDTPILSVRSNRTAFTIHHDGQSVDLVVRGQNLPGTVRMAAAAIEAFAIDSRVFSGDYTKDWGVLWSQTRSEYDMRYNPDAWIAIYVNGAIVYSNLDGDKIHTLENVAKGGEITPKVAQRAAMRLSGQKISFDVDHDSQMAVVFSVVKSSFKVSILLRQRGAAKSFAFKMLRGQDKMGLATVLNAGANVIEAMNLNGFVSRIQQQATLRRASDPEISSDQKFATIKRYRDLTAYIVAYETAHNTEWFPEKPEFLTNNAAQTNV